MVATCTTTTTASNDHRTRERKLDTLMWFGVRMGDARYSRPIVTMNHRVPHQTAMQFRLRAWRMKRTARAVRALIGSVMLFAFVHTHAAQLTVRAVDHAVISVRNALA